LNEIPDSTNTEVQLFLADNSKVSLDEKEPVLLYKQDGKINTNNQEINNTINEVDLPKNDF